MTRARHPGEPGNEAPEVAPWQLERYLLSELPWQEAAAVERAVAASPELRQRLEALRRDGDQTLAQYPPAWMARQIRRRREAGAAGAGQPGAAAWWWRLAPVAVALAAVAALPGLWSGDRQGAAEHPVALRATDPGVRHKGTPFLVVHRKTATGSERLESGAAAYPGDLLLVQYHGAGRAYGAILSVDGRGAVTQHLPAAGSQAAALDDSGLATMGYAYELDDAPRWERFLFVTSDEPFSVAAVAAAVGRGSDQGTLELPSQLELYSFELDKSAAPQVSAAAEEDGR